MSEVSELQPPSELGGSIIENARRVVKDSLSKLNEGKSALASKLLDGRTLASSALLVSTLVLAGCGNTESSSNSVPSSPNRTEAVVKTPEAFRTETRERIIFKLDKDNLPVSFRTPGSKSEVQIDRTKVLQAKEKALVTHEPEVAAIATAPIEQVKTPPSKEHPVLKELPKDTLTTEQIKQRGIAIMQADNTSLYIRAGAFAKDGPLSDFTPDGKNHMNIVLLNAPVVSAYFMSDPKYAEVRKIFLAASGAPIKPGATIDPEVYRQKKIADLTKSIKQYEPIQNRDSELQIMSLKGQILDLQEKPKDQIMADQVLDSEAAPGYVNGGFFRYYDNNIPTSMVLLGVGHKSRPDVQRSLVVFNSKGELELTQQPIYGAGGV